VSNRSVVITFSPPAYLGQNLVETFKEVEPTDLVAVPRVYEKLEQFVN